MVIMLGKPLNIAELKSITTPDTDKRRRVPILVVDDEDFPSEAVLRQHDYNVRVVNDLEDIKAASEYPIVACDIKGIGKSYQSRYEGAHVLEELRKRYPYKVLVAFSAYALDPTFNKYLRLCDEVLSKDSDSHEWILALDRSIDKVLNPIMQWNRLRDFLIMNEVSLYHVFRLEQEFIGAVLQQNIRKFGQNRTVNSLPSDIKTVLLGFASNALFRLVTGP